MNLQLIVPILYLTLVSCASPPRDLGSRLDNWDERQAAFAQAHERSNTPWASSASLQTLLDHARRHNPGLRAAFERWKGAMEKVTAATTLPNPRLTLGAYLASVETRVGPMQGRIGFAQPLPWPGKLAAAGKLAFEQAEALRMQVEVERLMLDQTVREVWWELAWLDRALKITQSNQELLGHWEVIAQTRMETGLGSHTDVIRTQIELGKLVDRIQGLQDLARPVRARLNSALHRKSDAALPQADLAEAAHLGFNAAALSAGLPQNSPQLLKLKHLRRAAQHRVDLAELDSYPNLTVGADLTFIGDANDPNMAGSGDEAFALTLGIELPVWRESYAAQERSAKALLRASERTLQQTHNTLDANLEMAFFQHRDGVRRVALFQDSLIPKGEEALRSLQAAYQSGKGGFLDLIDAQRALLEFQLQAARAHTDRAQALAKIEQLSGVSLHQDK